MMKVAMLSALAGVTAAKLTGEEYSSLFAEWRAKHGKEYETEAELQSRLEAFIGNHEIIEAHNAGDSSYTLGHNEFSDMTFEEFSNQYLGFQRPTKTVSREVAYELTDAAASAPDSVDWVAKGAVNAVKNQGQCGSCWAFSTTAAVEGAIYIATGELKSFAEQDLVDCDAGFFRNHGCNGGMMDTAFKHIVSKGQCLESDYPYEASQGTCNKSCDKSQAKISTYKDVPPADEDALKAAVALTPVSVALEADKSAFQLYNGGVMDNTACGTTLDHAVLIVGYGTDNGEDYWKVRNSWGGSWGEEGYIRIARNTGGVGMCGIAQMPSYPIV